MERIDGHIRSRRDAIVARWLADTVASYPADAADFLARRRDRFANPVGRALADGLAALCDELLEGADPTRLCAALEEILRIRAVQEFTPAAALRFVFQLKDAVRAETAEADARTRSQRRELERRIDQLALFGFDVYVKCREEVYRLRVAEIRKGYVEPA